MFSIELFAVEEASCHFMKIGSYDEELRPPTKSQVRTRLGSGSYRWLSQPTLQLPPHERYRELDPPNEAAPEFLSFRACMR